MRWDIELQLGWLHLPDFFEDYLPSRIVSGLLGKYTVDSPLSLDFDLKEKIHTAIAKQQQNAHNARVVAALGLERAPTGLATAGKQLVTDAISEVVRQPVA